MFDCRFCKFKSEAPLPLYRMCCQVNMTYRCIDIINRPDDDIHQDDIDWLRKNEEERKSMTTYRPLTTKAYRCYHDMYTLLERNREVQWGQRNLDYCVIKIINKQWYQRSLPPTTVYVNIQVIDSQLTNQKLFINNISNRYGEESYNGYVNAKRRITRLRNRFRNQQQYQQIINDYAYFQRRLVNDASEILSNLRNSTTIERNLMEEFNEVAKEDLVTKEKVIQSTDCAICFDNLGETNKMILRCGHQFCGDCIFRHYQCHNGGNCPSCRAQFV